MTRPFNQTFHCPNCKTWHTSETLFGRWIRNNSDLESQYGYCVTDQDYWIHRFKTYGNRAFQLLMLVEVKTNGASLTPAQTDTLHIINQFLRNRRSTPTKESGWQPGNVLNAYSTMNGAQVSVRAYGMHVLKFSGLGPDDSAEIWWDDNLICPEKLTQILRFDLDPDSLRPIDLRNHHRTHSSQLLPLDFA